MYGAINICTSERTDEATEHKVKTIIPINYVLHTLQYVVLNRRWCYKTLRQQAILREVPCHNIAARDFPQQAQPVRKILGCAFISIISSS